MSSSSSNAWLFGPIPDLLFGSGLLYFIVLAAVTMAGSADGGVLPAGTTSILILMFSGAHYGGTLLRVFEHADQRRTYRIFTLHATVLMILVLLGALYSPTAGSLLITIYLTWSPWHYTGQNYGIAVMFLRRRGVEISPAAKNWLYASFVLSYLSVFVNFHFEGGIGQSDPLGYSADASSGFQFVSLALPGAIRTVLLSIVGLAYLVAIGMSLFLLVRASNLKAVAPAGMVMLTQSAWFAIPHLTNFAAIDTHIPALTLKGAGNFEAYFVWAAFGHAIQYLWITAYYAKKDPRWSGMPIYFVKAFVFGNAIWAAPLILMGPDTLGRPDYDGGLALCVAAAVNIHHFIVDGAIWKLRNPKIAAVLLRNVEAAAQDALAMSRSRWMRRTAWGFGGLFALTAVLSLIELEKRLPTAMQNRDYQEVEAILDRAALYGRDSSQYRTMLGNQLIKEHLPSAALPHFWRSLALHPQPDGFLQVGVLNEKLRGTEFALLAWEKGLERFPDDLGLNQRLGLSLVKLRRMNQARPYLERTLELDPDNAVVRRALDEVHARAKGA